jgi:hypothetical protein
VIGGLGCAHAPNAGAIAMHVSKTAVLEKITF